MPTKTRVLVYGSLRNGMGNHCRLDGQESVGTTLTTEKYAMYSLGGFPMVQLTGLKQSHIVVEAYDVDERGLASLNSLEGYNGVGQRNFYDCSLVNTIDYGEGRIYHIEDRNVDPKALVDNGDWVDFYTHIRKRGW